MSLFRFSKRKHLEDFVNEGILCFGIATSYLEIKLTEAQRDNEQTRICIPDLKKTKFVINGSIAFKNVELKHTARDIHNNPLQYYLMSFARIFDARLYEEFEADSCIEILDEEKFKQRLGTKLKKLDYKGYLSDVAYYDPKQLQAFLDFKDILFSKEIKYAYQEEFRIVLFPPALDNFKKERIKIKIGALEDICKFVKGIDKGYI